MIRILLTILLSCSAAIAGQGMGPGPGVKGYTAGGGGTVERTGTAIAIDTMDNATGSQSITVPSDATLAVIFHGGAHDGTDAMFGSGGAGFTVNSVAATWRGRTTANQDLIDASVHTLVSPATGTQTFAWTGVSETSSRGLIMIVFYKGINTSDHVGSIATNTTTITGLTAPTGSMTVGVQVSYGTSPDASGNSQTVILNNSTANSTVADVAEKQNSTSFTVAGGDYSTALAIVLKP